jgi:hypothetical protein
MRSKSSQKNLVVWWFTRGRLLVASQTWAWARVKMKVLKRRLLSRMRSLIKLRHQIFNTPYSLSLLATPSQVWRQLRQPLPSNARNRCWSLTKTNSSTNRFHRIISPLTTLWILRAKQVWPSTIKHTYIKIHHEWIMRPPRATATQMMTESQAVLVPL